MSKWSLVGIVAGAIFAIGSFVRYFIVIPDNDRFVAYTTLGLLICGVAWLYNRTLALSNTLTAVEDYLADLNEYINQEKNE